MSFKPIETQEQFDEMIKERIGKVKESVRKEYEGYISPEQYEAFKGYISPEDMDAKINPMLEQIQSLSGSLESANEKIEALGLDITKKDQVISDKDIEIKGKDIYLMKLNAAIKYGIPVKICDRINGSTDSEIDSDAQDVSQYMNKSFSPLRNIEHKEPVDGVTKAFMDLNPNIKLTD